MNGTFQSQVTNLRIRFLLLYIFHIFPQSVEAVLNERAFFSVAFWLVQEGSHLNVKVRRFPTHTKTTLFLITTECCLAVYTLGINTIHSVNVVQNIVRNDVSPNDAVGLFCSTVLIGITRTHGTTTLYTDMPINLLSFKAGMCTLRVSQAKYEPKSSKRPIK